VDKKATGVIILTKESFVREEMSKKPGKPCIAVGTLERVYCMYPETDNEQKEWMRKLQIPLDRLKGVSGGTGTGTTGNNGTGNLTNSTNNTTNQNGMGGTNNGTNGINNTGTNTNTTQTNNNTIGQTNTGQTNNVQNNNGQTNTNTGQTNTGQNSFGQNNTGNNNVPKQTTTTTQTTNTTGGGSNVLVRAKDFIPFMVDDSNKVLEFWNIWFESIPKGEQQGSSNYLLVVSCDGGELSWRSSGPQNIFIQKMVDFFWNVGAPESEIDRLNDFGALVNPVSIGSWINMSKIGGMDGGWFFPVPLSLKIALEACDPDNGQPPAGAGSNSTTDTDSQVIKTFQTWAESNRIEESIYIGRDMGAAPPRQTEIRVRLNQNTVTDQLNIALAAFKTFRFPEVPGNILNILRQFVNPGLILSVILSSEGFVKIGILFPNPNWNVAIQLIDEGRKLCENMSSGTDIFGKLNGVFNVTAPEFIEFQYLQPGFGYNVYKEEFNVLVHYKGN